jgi:hypothetical protein
MWLLNNTPVSTHGVSTPITTFSFLALWLTTASLLATAVLQKGNFMRKKGSGKYKRALSKVQVFLTRWEESLIGRLGPWLAEEEKRAPSKQWHDLFVC